MRDKEKSVKSIRSRSYPSTIICVLTIAVLGLPAMFFSTFTSARITHAAGGSFTRQIPIAGTSTPLPGTDGTNDPAWPEFAGATDNNPGPAPYNGAIFDRSQSKNSGHGASGQSGQKAKSNPVLNLSIDGLNHRQQRLANGVNQFSVEPPHQGLCASSSYVIEAVNDVARVFVTRGKHSSEEGT